MKEVPLANPRRLQVIDSAQAEAAKASILETQTRLYENEELYVVEFGPESHATGLRGGGNFTVELRKTDLKVLKSYRAR